MKRSNNAGSSEKPKLLSTYPINPEIAAEAAAWIAHLHGPNRSAETQREFQAWQARSPLHRVAFECCTDVWQDVAMTGSTASENPPAYQQPATSWMPNWRHAGFRVWATAAGGAATCTAALILTLHSQDTHSYLTHVGEQRVVVLDDGSRMTMNTDTKLRVDFGHRQRTVDIEKGEAFFDVAKDAGRPFVVKIAGSEVVAVGTAFSVRYAPTGHATDQLAVTLVEGHVKVRSTGGTEREALSPSGTVLMNPGERLLLGNAAGQRVAPVLSKLDQPKVESAMAWKRGEAIFNETPLVDAINDINRYSHTTIVLSDDVAASNLHISGLFHVDDIAGFAEAVAAIHGLTVRKTKGRLELTRLQ